MCAGIDSEAVVEPVASDEAAAAEQQQQDDAPATPPSPRRLGPEGKRVFAFGSSGWCAAHHPAAAPRRAPRPARP